MTHHQEVAELMAENSRLKAEIEALSGGLQRARQVIAAMATDRQEEIERWRQAAQDWQALSQTDLARELREHLAKGR
jgi:predicted  nucleic acid-binding Zn-ribbon protein